MFILSLLKHHRTNLDIREIGGKQVEGENEKEKKKEKKVHISSVSACRLHMQQEVFLFCPVTDMKKLMQEETTHTRSI